MTRNKLTDLNNHLFEQLERLNNEDLVGDELTKEISRSKAITDVSRQIIDTARIGLAGAKFMTDLPRADRADVKDALPEAIRK